MNDGDPEKEHPTDVYVIADRWVRWALRIVLLFAAVGFLAWASDDQLARLANWVSFVWPIATLYIVTLEPHFLAWVIAKVRRAFEIGQAKKNRRRVGWFSWQSRRGNETGERPTESSKDSNDAAILIDEGLNSREGIVGSIESRVQASREQIGASPISIVGLAILGMFVAAGVFQSDRMTSAISAPRIETIVELPKDVVEVNPVPERSPEETQEGLLQSQTGRSYIEVQAGDTCYGIAISCVGDGERFVELGGAANDWLDVSNRERCLIRPADKLKLPDKWPSGCAD